MSSVPSHVAIIMDGNGRWGIKKKKSRNYGHKEGIKTVDKIIYAAIYKKIKYLETSYRVYLSTIFFLKSWSILP